MKLKNLNKALVGGVVALTATSGLIASTMVSASADPTRPYAATGSDTIQDVWNGLTNDFGAVAPSIASWNAFVVPNLTGTIPDSYIQTKTGGAWFLRPSGSGAGIQALSSVWDPSGTNNHLFPPTGGNGSALLTHSDVDFARSSGGPVAGTGLKFLPFARDAVSIAFKPTTGLTAPLNLTTSQLKELYSGVDDNTDSVVTFSAQPSTSTTVVSVNGVVVHPKIPQSASGTRKFFLTAIGVSNSVGAEAPYISDPGTAPQGGIPENSGTPLTTAGDLAPFSAAQWIAQQNGTVTDTTSGLALASLNGAAPTTGTAPALKPGALFGHTNLGGNFDVPPTGVVGTFNRDTYDVVPTSFLSGTSAQQALVSILGGGIGGASGAGVIKAYGFGILQYIGDSAKFLDGNWQH
jgi:hypothetical protein